ARRSLSSTVWISTRSTGIESTAGTRRNYCVSPDPMPLFGKKETATIIYISHDNVRTPVAVTLGDSVMEGAIKNGIDGIVAECGGAAQCGTCHVYVDEAWLPKLAPMQEDENEMLNTTVCPRRTNSRLSCQINVTKELDGLIVHTPEAQV